MIVRSKKYERVNKYTNGRFYTTILLNEYLYFKIELDEEINGSAWVCILGTNSPEFKVRVFDCEEVTDPKIIQALGF